MRKILLFLVVVGLVALPLSAGIIGVSPSDPTAGGPGGGSPALGGSPAVAGVLYDNGAINGNIGAFSITGAYGWMVTDSFTLGGASTVTGAEGLGLWVYPGDVPQGLDWAITSDPFGGTVYGSGTTGLGVTYWGQGFGFYDIYDGSFSIAPLNLAAGTYYLELSGAYTLVSGQPVYWDENDGLSTAYQNQGVGLIGSEAFRILGTQGGGIPEPASLVLFGSGLLLLGGLLRRRLS